MRIALNGKIHLVLKFFRSLMIRKIIFNILIIFVSLVFICSCDLPIVTNPVVVIEKKDLPGNEKEFPDSSFYERKWNIFIYMPADNNLESAALEDILEMESSKLDVNQVSVFFLLDRSINYDTSNENWSGTRLYRLKTGRNNTDKNIISEEIECPDLGLYPGVYTKLDLSSNYVLSKIIKFINEKFPAENNGLIMWGHGTGWRNDFYQLNKGFAYSETSQTYMSLKQLGQGLRNGLDGKKYNFIGFDTCFGAELEVVYELKDYGDFFTGSEGLVMSAGWDYCNLLNQFQKSSDKSSEKLCLCAVEQFKKQYGSTSRASIVSVNMNRLPSYFQAFDNFSKSAAESIKNRDVRNDLIGKLYADKDCKAELYTYGAVKSDIYIDVSSLVNILFQKFPEKLTAGKNAFVETERNLIISSWASDRENGGLGILFSTLNEGNLLSTVHSSNYIKGKTYEQIAFVNDSVGYVPTKNNSGSLLDKLFYTDFQ